MSWATLIVFTVCILWSLIVNAYISQLTNFQTNQTCFCSYKRTSSNKFVCSGPSKENAPNILSRLQVYYPFFLCRTQQRWDTHKFRENADRIMRIWTLDPCQLFMHSIRITPFLSVFLDPRPSWQCFKDWYHPKVEGFPVLAWADCW